MTAVAVIVFLLLLAISALHLAWGLGSTFPAADEQALSRLVTGFKHRDGMPPRPASIAVAAATLIAGLWALALAGTMPLPLPGWLTVLGGIALSLVFLARGVATYTPAWRKLTPERPFARLDTRIYGPLCLLLGAGFALLTKGFAS
jgi:hypothetical protein